MEGKHMVKDEDDQDEKLPQRPCNKCHKMYQPQSKFNRQCSQCNKSNRHMSPRVQKSESGRVNYNGKSFETGDEI